jgi:stress response protein SCP2
LFDGSFKDVDLCYFGSKKAGKGSIRHSGDNLTGQGEGDDESIKVDLGAIPVNVEWVVFTVNSYRGHKFSEIRNAYCRLLDGNTGAELVRFNLTEAQPRTGVIMAVLRRVGATWDMTAIGEFADGQTVKNMVKPSAAVLRQLAGS